MEEKNRSAVDGDKEIIFSRAIKAGKRIYYLDVKKNRKEDMFISITESKKVVTGEETNPQVVFEKHKIFLYQEDFEKFMNGLNQVMRYIDETRGPYVSPYYNKEREDEEEETLDTTSTLADDGHIKIDIDF
jgi:hypothetical protein